MKKRENLEDLGEERGNIKMHLKKRDVKMSAGLNWVEIESKSGLL
jgi:hypothetical protein